MNTSTKVQQNLSLENIENEIWKDIPNYEGLYQVSSFGRVKSLYRHVNCCNGIKSVSSRILKITLSTTKYHSVNLSKEGKTRTRQIHQLIAMAFLKHKPNGYKGLVVDHINNIRTDNRLENLQLITPRENTSKDRVGISKYVGVKFNKKYNNWVSSIRINNKHIGLGTFTKELDAANEYKRALKQYEEAGKVIVNTPFSNKITSKHKGIYQHKVSLKWVANCFYKSNRVYLGLFDTEDEAVIALLKFKKTKSKEGINPFIDKKSSKYKGVSFYKKDNKWDASIKIKGCKKHLGRFKNEIDAHKCYENELKRLQV